MIHKLDERLTGMPMGLLRKEVQKIIYFSSILLSFPLILLIVLIIGLSILRLPKVIGWFGERGVARELNKLDPAEYMVLHNIVIPSKNGKTTQIDHVVVSIYGIFVIETKNYKGWIIGSEYSESWTQIIYKRKERLYNPIRQNFGHIRAVEQLLDNYPELPMFSIVCFSNRAALKVQADRSNVINTRELIHTIEMYEEMTLSPSELKLVFDRIAQGIIVDKDINKRHVAEVKEQLIDNEIDAANDRCPRCGGDLKVREGKYGRFKGCSAYPQCRYTYSLLS